MKELQGFTQSLIATRKMDGAPEDGEWYLAMIDALIYASIEDAAKNGRKVSDCIASTALMLYERIPEWVGSDVREC
jgi:hypothetical protein